MTLLFYLYFQLVSIIAYAPMPLIEHISPREEKHVILDNDCRYKIYSYQVKHTNTIDNSDLVIRLFFGNSPTTRIYVSQNRDSNLMYFNDGRVTGFDWEFSANSKEIVIYSFLRNYSNRIVIVFYDNHYAFKDYFYLIEETEPIRLQAKVPIVIDKFYHLNYFELYFISRDPGTKYEIMVNSKETNQKGRVDVFLGNSEIPVNSTQCLYLNEVIEMQDEDIFRIRVINEVGLSSLSGNEVSILVNVFRKSIIKLNEDTIEASSVILQGHYYYYIDLNVYAYKETGSITIHFSHESVIDNGILSVAFGKTVIGKHEEFDNLVPIAASENEINWERDHKSNLYYHSYFNKTIDERYSYLLLYFEFKGDWFPPFKFSVSQAKRIQTVFLYNEYRKTFEARSHLPYYFNIVVNKLDANKTLIIQSYTDNSLIIMNDRNDIKAQVKSVYKEIVSSEHILVKFSIEYDNNITFIVTVKDAEVLSISSFPELHSYTERSLNCLKNVYFYFYSNYSYNEEHEEYGQKIDVFIQKYNLYTIDSISSITNDLNQIYPDSMNGRYTPVTSFNEIEQRVLLVQCKRILLNSTLSITVTAKDFSIGIQWDKSVHQDKLFNIYLIKNMIRHTMNANTLINTVKPYDSFISNTNTSNHILYPIKPGKYYLLMVSFKQVNNTLELEENEACLVIIPSIFPTGANILFIILVLMCILALILFMKQNKPKVE